MVSGCIEDRTDGCDVSTIHQVFHGPFPIEVQVSHPLGGISDVLALARHEVLYKRHSSVQLLQLHICGLHAACFFGSTIV